MNETPDRSKGQSGSTMRGVWLPVLAGAIIVLCIGWLIYQFIPTKPIVLPEEVGPAAQWMKSFQTLSAEHASKVDAFYRATANLIVAPNDAKTGIVIGGRVATTQELALVKDELQKISSSVPIEWNVRVGN